jgi:hypothetical protein
MIKFKKSNIFLIKRHKLIIGQLNIRLKISHMFTLINSLTISHKIEFKKELNIKPSRNKSFTHLLRNKLFKLKDNKLPKLFNQFKLPPKLFNQLSNQQPLSNNQSLLAELLLTHMLSHRMLLHHKLLDNL